MRRGFENAAPDRGHYLYCVIILLFCVYLFTSPVAEVYSQETDRGKAVSLYSESSELFKNGDVGNAIKAIRKALTADPNYPEAYDKLGYLLIQKGDFGV